MLKLLLPALIILRCLNAFALPEATLKTDFDLKLIPFLQTGERFSFKSTDGLQLSAIRFTPPNPKGSILVVTGRSEPWLKYVELFYDLYQKGYSVYSYDHRGQGLSPHLSPINPEIGHTDHFSYYVRDLNTFVEQVLVPNNHSGLPLYLLAHSMGGGITAAYLSEYEVPFKKAILSAPMLQINTKPYPEPIAHAIVALSTLLGLGSHYSPGHGDDHLDTPFEGNTLTRSENRYWMENEILRRNPEVIIGGPSNSWVNQSIKATHRIRREMGEINIPFLLFQAEKDQIVKPMGQLIGCKNAGDLCTLIVEPDSQHEMLMERDMIRDDVMNRMSVFFN